MQIWSAIYFIYQTFNPDSYTQGKLNHRDLNAAQWFTVIWGIIACLMVTVHLLILIIVYFGKSYFNQGKWTRISIKSFVAIALLNCLLVMSSWIFAIGGQYLVDDDWYLGLLSTAYIDVILRATMLIGTVLLFDSNTRFDFTLFDTFMGIVWPNV